MKKRKNYIRLIVAMFLIIAMCAGSFGGNLAYAGETQNVSASDTAAKDQNVASDKSSETEKEEVLDRKDAGSDRKDAEADKKDAEDDQKDAESDQKETVSGNQQQADSDVQDQKIEAEEKADDTDSQVTEDEKIPETVSDQEEAVEEESDADSDKDDLSDFYTEGKELKSSVNDKYSDAIHYIYINKSWDVPEGTEVPEKIILVVKAYAGTANEINETFEVYTSGGTRGPKIVSAAEYNVWTKNKAALTIEEYDEAGNKLDYNLSFTTSTRTMYNGRNEAEATSIGYWCDVTLTNSLKQNITVKKDWKNLTEGSDNYKVVCQYAAKVGEKYTCELSSKNGWQYTFENMPLKDLAGNDYTVSEIGVYNIDDTENETNLIGLFDSEVSKEDTTYTIINTKKDNLVSLKVKKKWEGLPDDFSLDEIMLWYDVVGYDSEGKRLGDDYTFSITLDSYYDWSQTFTFPKYDTMGNLITYQLENEMVKDYADYDYEKWEPADITDQFDLECTVVHKGDSYVYNLTNTYKMNKKVQISGTKTWDDEDDLEGIRPDSVTVHLLADGKEIDSQKVYEGDDGTWKYSFEDKPKYQKDESTGAFTEIKYTVTEDTDGYTTTIKATDEGYDITNTHKVERTQIEVTKEWDDEALASEAGDTYKRPEVTVYLTANGETVMKDGKPYTITLDGTPDENGETSNWKATFTNLLKYYKGEAIQYKTNEYQVPGYSSMVAGTTITNTPATTNSYNSYPVSIKKTDDQTGVVLAGATFEVKNSEGTSMGTSVATDEKGMTTVSFTEPGTYTVTEVGAPTGYQLNEAAYTVVVTTDGIQKISVKENALEKLYNMILGEGTTEAYKDGVLTITDAAKTTDLTLKKVWDDSENQDGKRADYGVTLYKTVNGETTAVGDEITMDPDTLTYEWKDLPTYESGYEITYSVKETNVPEGYTSTTDTKAITFADGVATITNKHTPAMTIATVKKVWDDSNNKNKKRPDSITVDLMNGATKVKTVTLSADEDWIATVKDLPAYENQKMIVYTWEETDVPDGYKMTANQTDGAITTITNHYSGTTIKKDTTPTKKTTTTTKKTTTPTTGDHSHILLWLLLAAAAFCAMVSSVFLEKRRR